MERNFACLPRHTGQRLHEHLLFVPSLDGTYYATVVGTRGMVGYCRGDILHSVMGASKVVEFIGYPGVIVAECSHVGDTGTSRVVGVNDGG